MERPGNQERCNNCSHKFGNHYVAYDGKTHGCSEVQERRADDIRNDRAVHCFCGGFAIVQVWKPSVELAEQPR
jgi:hypothetical protein